MFEERVDLSNDMTGRQMIAVGVRRVVLARGELDRLEGPGYAARRAELRRKAKEAARTRDRQAAASQDEAEETKTILGARVRQQVGVPHGAHHRRILSRGAKETGNEGPRHEECVLGMQSVQGG